MAFSRPLMTRMLVSSAALLLSGIIGCKTTAPEGGSLYNSQLSPGATDDYAAVLKFRNIFRELAVRQGFKDSDIQKMIYLPTKSMVETPAAAMAATSAEEANLALVKLAGDPKSTPYNVYDHGRKTPFESVDVDQALRENGPITFVVIPGIFGEFIDHVPFEEIFKDSSFRRNYQDKLKPLSDSFYDLNSFSEKPASLAERVILGGIDDAQGHPRVQALLMKHTWGSLESVGSSAAVAATLLRRLNTAFGAIPEEQRKNVYLIGYSRGTPVAYEMVIQAQANREKYPNITNVKGLVTLAGVNYGTELADDAFDNQNSGTYKALTSVQKILENLTIDPSKKGFISEGKFFSSWYEVFNYACQLVGAIPSFAPPEQMKYEPAVSSYPHPMFIVGVINKIMTKMFSFSLSPTEIGANIKRAKVIIDQMVAGAVELSTTSRLAWWKTHLLPENFEIYSIAGSMPEESTSETNSILLGNPYYGAQTLDFRVILRKGYYDLHRLTGGAINDSQVLEPKSHYWPALATKFNPKQPPLRGYYLGILGTHHWGLAFPIAVDDAQGAVNPFPRTVLIESFAAFIASARAR